MSPGDLRSGITAGSGDPRRTEHSQTPRAVAWESWQLTPEGAAIHPGERTAVIADVHLGYEWARGAAGDCVPAHSLDETRARLDRVLARASVERLIVAGDLVESPRPCPRTAADLRRLMDWLGPLGVELVVLEGNHDRSPMGVSKLRRRSTGSPPLPSTCTVDGWTIGHGHRPIVGDRTISGHVHPVVRVAGVGSPCFLVGPGRIVLPAFSRNAAGWDALTAAVPRDWQIADLRCFASTGDDILDLGLMPDMRRALSRLSR
jgi:putative SbcD/Mre11-related phosphoesterase